MADRTRSQGNMKPDGEGTYDGPEAPEVVEREFLDASIAVWREIDRQVNEDGEYHGIEYHGIEAGIELRQRERAAWEDYRDQVLDA